MSRSLIVLPDETAKPILDAIDAARESLRIKMFEFSDPSALHASRSPGRGMGSLSTCLLRLIPRPMSPPNTKAEPAIINQCGKSNTGIAILPLKGARYAIAWPKRERIIFR